MEAATLPKKKTGISKGKLKKTMKNILCRPDPLLWPLLSEEHSKNLENVLIKFKVEIPEFKKPHWSELKEIPKEKRPKGPKTEKVRGLLFGLSICARSIPTGLCSGIIIDADVNPRILVQHIIDACITAEVPFLCLKELKRVTSTNFGFPTCCLGVEKDCDSVSEIRNKIEELSKHYLKQHQSKLKQGNSDVEMKTFEEQTVKTDEEKAKTFSYLYRKCMKTRVFIPPSENVPVKKYSTFVGQDFIEFSSNSDKKLIHQPKSNLSMIVKRITSNPNRNKKS